MLTYKVGIIECGVLIIHRYVSNPAGLANLGQIVWVVLEDYTPTAEDVCGRHGQWGCE